MKNISNETKKVLEVIKLYGPVRPTELKKILQINTKNTYKHLTRLLDEQLIKKEGTIPRVFYSVNNENKEDIIVYNKNNRLIEENYMYVSPSGEMISGIRGFKVWCNKNQFDFEKEKELLSKRLKEIQKLKKNGLISGKKLILSSKREIYLDEIFFSDFYNIDHFGKTKLGQLVYLGKSSQSKPLIMEIARLIKPTIEELIKKYNIGLVCFIPPTIDRKIQFLEVLKRGLKLDLPEINAVKIPSPTKIPQKTLRKIEDRIINAQKTIAINPNQTINTNILIVDDATGSGATMNETAKKIRNISKKNIKIVGYSVVGSFKGFDVISEV